ncbi:hypothetical protein ACPDHL_12105 [Myroides sp. C15-4]|uniref:hypothetical protein n=1 Tax=Myroides sp. C15-4 TaxID=3400532 RepID=UPI003D2F8394
MTHSIKLAGLASLLLLLGSCSSDDSNKPTTEKKHFISTVAVTKYKQYMSDSEVSTQPFSHSLYSFNYKENQQLSTIDTKTTAYTPLGEVDQVYQGNIRYQLNTANQLLSLDFTHNSKTTQAFTYTYNQDLLASYTLETLDSSYQIQYTYNTKKQFITAVDMNQSPEFQDKFGYEYNTANQLIEIKDYNMDNATAITYTAIPNPFYTLPFDLTTLIYVDLDLVPFNYMFSTTIASIKGRFQHVVIEYEYNEANLPISATATVQRSDSTVFPYMKIEYTYTEKEVQIKN